MAEASPKLIHQGTLIKSPPESKSKDLGRWRKRYFRLWSTKLLEYYKTDRSKDFIKKPIDLNKCRSIDGYLKNKKWNNIFCLNTTERKFYLVADSPEVMKEWISKICDLCGFSVEDNGSGVRKSVDSPLDSPIMSPSPDSTHVRDAGQMSPRVEEAYSSSHPINLHDQDLVYDKDLPPVPDSPETQQRPTDLSLTQATQPMKQRRQQTDCSELSTSIPSSYDIVPPPRPVERRASGAIPLESARLNQLIKDDSYIDMQSESCPISFPGTPVSPPSNHLPQHAQSSYDTVPPPIPASKYPTMPGPQMYDNVPKPRPKDSYDEYIDCDASYEPSNVSASRPVKKPTIPPIPDATYTGFDTLPEVGSKEPQGFNQPSYNNDIHDLSPPLTDDHPPMRRLSEEKPPRPPLDKSADLIYDHPPPPSADDIYDEPPRRVPYSSQTRKPSNSPSPPSTLSNAYLSSIYNAPPIPHRRSHEVPIVERPVSSKDSGVYNDSIYDTPPLQNPQSSEMIVRERPVSSKDSGVYNDSIYDTPPLQSLQSSQMIVRERPVSSKDSGVYNDSIYDTPPLQNPQSSEMIVREHPVPSKDSGLYSDSIYDTPPLQNPQYSEMIVREHPVLSKDSGLYSDSIYDTPPLQNPQSSEMIARERRPVSSQDSGLYSDSIYDTPPVSRHDKPSSDMLVQSYKDRRSSSIKDRDVFIDSVYNTPPNLPTSSDIYDFPPSSADLFCFETTATTTRPPKVDRTLKHASTSQLDMAPTLRPPPVDRSNRPVLASSVPVFPSNIDRYMNFPVSGSNAASAADSIYDYAMDFGTPSRNNLQYSQVEFATADHSSTQHRQLIEQQQRQNGFADGGRSDYSSVEPHLTKAMHDAKLTRDYNHAR
eukprot:gene7550-8387_t